MRLAAIRSTQLLSASGALRDEFLSDFRTGHPECETDPVRASLRRGARPRCAPAGRGRSADGVPGRLTRLQSLNTGRTRSAPRPRLKPRGLPPALEPHLVYTARSPLEAAEWGHDLLGPHRVTAAAGDRLTFGATFHAVLVRDVTLGYLDYETAVRVEIQRLPDDVLVIVPAAGTSRISIGEEVIDTSPVHAVVPRPGAPLVLECSSDTAHLIVRIDRQAFDVHLSRLLGRSLPSPIEFRPFFDLTEARASRWNFAIQMLHAELYEPESLLHRGAGHGQLEEFVMSSLLYSQPSNYTEMLSPSTRSARRAVRAACDHIERNLATDLSVAAIADAAGVSVRTLQHQFSEDLDQTITGYVRNRRLERVRAELADAAPGAGVTVTAVASRWGFAHLGRFAVTYRERFGESPSVTLRS